MFPVSIMLNRIVQIYAQIHQAKECWPIKLTVAKITGVKKKLLCQEMHNVYRRSKRHFCKSSDRWRGRSRTHSPARMASNDPDNEEESSMTGKSASAGFRIDLTGKVAVVLGASAEGGTGWAIA